MSQKVKCECCGTVLMEYVAPCADFPAGAFRVIARHHGERHETVVPLPVEESVKLPARHLRRAVM